MALAQGKKVLIVDDDDFILEMGSAALVEAGFDVKKAKDGQEAWEALQSGYTPDVVFTGILMPRMSGFDFIRKMQSDDRLSKIPVAISSHRGRPEDRETAKMLGVDDFLIQGAVPLVEMIRRLKLLVGIRERFWIKLDHNAANIMDLVALLNKQQQTSLSISGNKELFAVLEPQQETGQFRVILTEEHQSGEERPGGATLPPVPPQDI